MTRLLNSIKTFIHKIIVNFYRHVSTCYLGAIHFSVNKFFGIGVFDGDAERLTGQILDIQIEESSGFTLFGTACLV